MEAHDRIGDGHVISAENRRQRYVAYGTGGFALAGNATIQFLVPLRAVELGIEISLLGVLLGTKALTEALMATPLGRALDTIGVRRAFIIGTAAWAVTLVAYGFATSFLALLALQIVLGMSRPLAWVSAQHYVSGMRTGADQAHDTGRMSFVANAGQIVGPLMGGLAASAWGLEAAFLVLAAYCGAFVILGLALPSAAAAGPGRKSSRAPSSPGTSPQNGVRATFGLLTMPKMQAAMLLTSARLWMTTAWMSFFPLYLVVEAQMSEAMAGTVVSTMALTATAFSLSAGRLSTLARAESLTAASLAVAAAGLALGPFLGASPLVYLSAVLVGVGHGVSLPMLIVIVRNAAPEGQRGLALGLRTTFNQTAATLAPAMMAPLIAVAGAALAFPVASVVAGAGVLAAVVRTGSIRRRPTPSGS